MLQSQYALIFSQILDQLQDHRTFDIPFLVVCLWLHPQLKTVNHYNPALPAACHGHKIIHFDWREWRAADWSLIWCRRRQFLILIIQTIWLWQLNEAGCKVTKTGNESYVRDILSNHDHNGSVGRLDLDVPVCSVPCLMCLYLAQRTAARSYILRCIIFITLTANKKALVLFSASHGCLMWFHRRGKHYLWIVDMQISLMPCCSRMWT